MTPMSALRYTAFISAAALKTDRLSQTPAQFTPWPWAEQVPPTARQVVQLWMPTLALRTVFTSAATSVLRPSQTPARSFHGVWAATLGLLAQPARPLRLTRTMSWVFMSQATSMRVAYSTPAQSWLKRSVVLRLRIPPVGMLMQTPTHTGRARSTCPAILSSARSLITRERSARSIKAAQQLRRLATTPMPRRTPVHMVSTSAPVLKKARAL